MPSKNAKRIATINDNGVIQARILNKYHSHFIDKKRKVFCINCVREHYCFLLPICEDGSDCPYFIRRVVPISK